MPKYPIHTDGSGQKFTTFAEVVEADEQETARRRKGLECGHPADCLSVNLECMWCAEVARWKCGLATMRKLLDEARARVRLLEDT